MLPIVLCLSGHDPTGGAGIQADIETLFRLDCHACTVVTALTVQDTRNVRAVYPQDPERFRLQAETLIADLPIAAVKIGLVGSDAMVSAIAALLEGLPKLPVVLDPVLAAGGGMSLASDSLAVAITRQLLPYAWVTTPNLSEARRLTNLVSPDECARALIAAGTRHALLTNADEDDAGPVLNRLYGEEGGPLLIESVPRLPGTYHGSGCTLASAITAFLARRFPVEQAVSRGVRFTWNSLAAGFSGGAGQQLPDRRQWGRELI